MSNPVPSVHASALQASPLGRAVPAPQAYDPGCLFPLPRSVPRQALDLSGTVPFVGADVWTAYELSWLNARGKPQIGIATLVVPCDTPHIIESKSLKLYLHSLRDSRFDDPALLRDTVSRDLSEAVWRGQPVAARVGVQLTLPDAFERLRLSTWDGLSLDRLDIECGDESLDTLRSQLQADHALPPVEETLVSDLLQSHCPVTGQPDWASVRIAYTGAAIDQARLLRYLIGYRQHHAFHESCVEQMFMDLWRQCRPLRLSVQARFTRRGGLDISPWRASHPMALPPHIRLARQ